MRRWGWRNILAVAVIAGLMCAHAVVSYSAIAGKSATVDEPSHAMQAYVGRWDGDYRIDTSFPPLWLRWVGWGLPRGMLRVNTDSPSWATLLDRPGDGWTWFKPILYDTPGNDADRFVNRARAMMVPIALLLGVVVAWWAWQLAGPIAAVVATALWALDPNFLAHGPIVKNDVAVAVCLTALAAAVWRLGRQPSVGWLVAVVLCCGAAVATKFTGLLAFPILGILLAIWALPFRVKRVAIVAGVFVACVAGTWGILWAVYGFRYGSGPTRADWIHLPAVVAYTTRMEMLGRDPSHEPTETEVMAERASMADRLALWTGEHRLLPEAFLAGFVYVRSYNQYRPGFLLGEIRSSGWWYYFPVAAVVKTPIASLAAAGLAAVVLLRRRWSASLPIDRWAVACLVAPLVVLGVAAMCSRQNVGIRHVLTMGPPIDVMIGIAAARAMKRWRRGAIVVCAVLAVGLASETLAAYPDFIDFFNVAVGGSRGGIGWLSDSNLDWGQDLKPLAAWRRGNPDGRLYLDYLGTADPRYYLGDDYVPLPVAMSQRLPWASDSGYLAVSATHLQGLYVPAAVARMYRELMREDSPVAVIGGSIYVYRLPLERNTRG